MLFSQQYPPAAPAPKDSNELLEFKERVLEQALLKPRPKIERKPRKKKNFFIELEDGQEKKPSLSKQLHEVLSSISSPGHSHGDSSAFSSPLPPKRRRTPPKHYRESITQELSSTDEIDKVMLKPAKKRKRSNTSALEKRPNLDQHLVINLVSSSELSRPRPEEINIISSHEMRNSDQTGNAPKTEIINEKERAETRGDTGEVERGNHVRSHSEAESVPEDFFESEQMSGGYSMNDQNWYAHEDTTLTDLKPDSILHENPQLSDSSRNEPILIPNSHSESNHSTQASSPLKEPLFIAELL